MANSDKKISIQNLKLLVRKFCEQRDWDQYHGAKDLAIGIITEAAELLEHFRFKNERQANQLLSNNVKRREISDEMADIFFFLLRLSQRFNIDLSNSLKSKMKKNIRKYPIRKAKGSNKKYTEF